MIDIFLDSEFSEEEKSFVFKAHDNKMQDYTVRVSFKDISSFLGISESEVDTETIRYSTGNEVVDVCRGIAHAYQTGTTSYDVEVKLTDKHLTLTDKLAEAYQKGYNDGAEAAANEISSKL